VRGLRLACLALALGPIGLEAQSRPWSVGVEGIVVAGDRWLSGVGLQVVVPAADQVRLSLFGAPALRGDELVGRSEVKAELSFANPANPRRLSWYLGAGLAADFGRQTDGYILLVAGLEGAVGRSGRWWVDGGVGGGPRLAFGARWPVTRRRKRKNGRPSVGRGRSFTALADRYSAPEPATSGFRCTGLLNRSPRVRT
jgi:hypothetical protein